MEALGPPADEIKQLRRCINDLVSIVTLPAIWSGGSTSQMVRTLTDVLMDTLLLDLLYVRLENPSGNAPFEMARLARSRSPMATPQEIGERLRNCLGLDPRKWPASARGCVGNGEICIAPLRLGLQGEIGIIAAGSERQDFPKQTERLLLSTAANQIVIALHQAWQLNEQRRVATELDQRVSLRTKELAEANEELRREIVERKRADEELRRSEAYLAEAQRLSRTGSFGWSPSTDEHFWSDETYRIFEYEVFSKVSLQMVRERVHPEDLPLFDQVINASKGDGFDFEYRLLLPTGAVKQVHVVAHAMRGEFGTHELVGAVMDITATRQAEAALRQAQTELAHVTRVTTMGELAASIAHEVNQPISGVVINGNASLLWLDKVKENSANVAELRQTLHRIIRDGERAGEIVARIRALFKKAQQAKEPLNLNEAIREILALAKSEMSKHRIALHLELADELPWALGDKVQLQQVMLNLILNAIDAMNTLEERSRDLMVRTQRSEDGMVMVTVRDSGIGLDRSSLEKVFSAFHTTKPGGLGMGLSISRSIVENHHGRLWASAHEGPGASFHFTLPTA